MKRVEKLIELKEALVELARLLKDNPNLTEVRHVGIEFKLERKDIEYLAYEVDRVIGCTFIYHPNEDRVELIRNKGVK